LQYDIPKNRNLVVKALKKAGRLDLVGTGSECLIRGEPKRQGYPYIDDKNKHKGKSVPKRKRR